MDNIEQLFVEINEVSNNLVDQMDEIKADYLLTKINNDDDLFHDLYEYSLNLLNTYIV